MIFAPRIHLWLLGVSALLLAACGSDDPPPVCDEATCDGVCVAGQCVASDGGSVDVLIDVTPDIPAANDTPREDASDFGLECVRNADCRSGYCVDTADGRACSVFCTESCPDPDWTCRIVENSGGDVVSICLPDAAVLCRACSSDSECGGLDDLCLELGDGSFCGRECGDGDECPEDFQCDEFSSQGELVRQCVPALGVCGDCVDQDDDGRGVGDGCVAADCDDLDPRIFEGAPEICDGWDNDCDEEVDEGIEFLTDEANCGECGVVCDPANASGECVDGGCLVVACEDGFWDDDGDADNGCEYECSFRGEELCNDEDDDCDGEVDEEVDLSSDPENCGDCGTVCGFEGATAACVEAECQIADCLDGLANCNGFAEDGCEVELAADPLHCGECFEACAFDNAGAVCDAGVCGLGTCDEGFDNCDGLAETGCEAELAVDLLHCGVCENLCEFESTSASCELGVCTPTDCAPGLLDCDEDLIVNGCEVDSRIDPAHCGRCGLACAFPNAAATCEESACTMGACEGSFDDCVNGSADGCETDTDTDDDHCGSCGTVCSFPNAAASCADGECVMGECDDGWADCLNGSVDGCETRIETDLGNCGGCGNVCEFTGADAICSSGECTMGGCATGLADCNGESDDGCERDLRTDPLHCGTCFDACDDTNASVVCEDRVCVIDECDTGFDDCNGGAHDGCEVDLSTDDLHCGVCRNACVASGGDASCVEGGCAITECTDGFGDCDERYDTGCEVPLVATLGHCGECFNECAFDNAFAACRFGGCDFLACDSGWGDCNEDVDLDGCETDLDTSLAHCGVCGRGCEIAGADEACIEGVCEFIECEPNRDGCVDGPENGCETDLLTNPDHCGECGLSCDLDFTVTECSEGSCATLGCDDGYSDCDVEIDGCDTHTESDPANCGSCGFVCTADNATSGCSETGCFIAGCLDGYTDGDGLYSTGCEVPPEGGGPDRSGTFAITPTAAYSCTDIFFGSTVMSINETSFTFSFGASLAVGMSRASMQQTPAPTGDSFSVTGIVAGDCQETYTLTGTFSDDDNWTGTFTLAFSGSTCGFTNCFEQDWVLSGTRI